ncbi:hypothetical protein FDP41_013336 [Naegleria fowleri]|uniref:BTB domain-containing protein n=2 Tax=Naegleria fowleri TaxID=5763 RepID=A0A6A5BR73_NAEFO|nr:uncharacterized protein FDP41_013336 [Naegleria fowleri]KAF0980553.1 hypothetical protein FDP41_013336 [Naegleria fowleri]CAG4717145.1 unnamed protein product [Naegleria fowleri]
MTHLNHPFIPIGLSCSNTHWIVETEQRTLEGGGQNTSGELGLGHEQPLPCLTRTTQIPLPFEWNEQDRVKVFVGPECTILVHDPCESVVVRNSQTFNLSMMNNHATTITITLEDWIISRMIPISHEIISESSSLHCDNPHEWRIFHPLVEKCSPDMSSVLKREEFLSLLNPQEKDWIQLFVSMFIRMNSDILLMNDDHGFHKDDHENEEDDKGSDVVHLYHSFFTNYFQASLRKVQFYVFLLFFLNDVNDIGVWFKKHCFETLSEMLETSNVFDIVQQISNYLSANVLTNSSKRSVLMLAVRKCLAFMKGQWNNMKHSIHDDERRMKLEKRIQTSKKGFCEIVLDWRENDFMKKNQYDSSKLLASLFNDITSSDLKCSIGDSSESACIIHVHKHVISALSPVLRVLYENDAFSDTSSSKDTPFDIYGFVRDSKDSEEQQELKRKALLIVLKSCYSNVEDLTSSHMNVDLLFQIILISLQFQMEWLTLFCCQILLQHVTPSNYKSILIFASQFDDVESCQYLIEYLITYGLKYIAPSELACHCKDLPLLLSSRLTSLQESIFGKGMVNWNLNTDSPPPPLPKEQDLYLRAVLFQVASEKSSFRR